MHKKNEINIVVAMEREAKPLINYWKLKKKTEKIFSNKKKKINLIISGIGKNKAKNATNHIAEKTSINSFFLNIGNFRECRISIPTTFCSDFFALVPNTHQLW